MVLNCSISCQLFPVNSIPLIDSEVDQNYNRGGTVAINYCERTNEHFRSENGESLSIKYKLNKGYIRNNDKCLKSIFLIVYNITNHII